jgi:hypothetical protein
MIARIKHRLGDVPFKCKKRLSTKGNTSPFEIYGDANKIESALFVEDIWEARTHLQLIKRNVLLPKDYDLPDAESEKDVRARAEEIKANARKVREGRGNPVQQLEAS